MIQDLFSHKIHSSGNDWPDKLVELAFLFNEFEGLPYDRAALERRLKEVSPRSAYAPRDRSKFRDEISAYPAYLGLYYHEPSAEGWVIRLSETTKRLLLREEPDVGAFLRLQLTLFQYPNGSGAAYYGGNRLRIQANAWARTLELIRQGVHLSPMRLICKAVAADAKLRGVPIFEARVTFAEVYALANAPATGRCACPSDHVVRETLRDARSGSIRAPSDFERRFHILNHTDIFEVGRAELGFRSPVSPDDEQDLRRKIGAISETSEQFNGFDAVDTREDMEAVLKRAAWGRYHDGITTLPAEVVRTLAFDLIESPMGRRTMPAGAKAAAQTYRLRRRANRMPLPRPASRSAEIADPEATRIKRQRRSLAHKILVDRVDQILRDLGATPMDSPHIDLYASLRGNGSFLFEMKSGGENVLDQIRKGLSQLYEYRFRYREQLAGDATLCLVLADDPTGIPWIVEFLCVDRRIAVFWLSGDGRIRYPPTCSGAIGPLGRGGAAIAPADG